MDPTIVFSLCHETSLSSSYIYTISIRVEIGCAAPVCSGDALMIRTSVVLGLVRIHHSVYYTSMSCCILNPGAAAFASWRHAQVRVDSLNGGYSSR